MAFVAMADAVPGAIASSSEYNKVVDNVEFLYANNARGFKAINTNTTQVTGITTTETVTDSVTFTAESSRRYLVIAQGGIFGSSSADQFGLQIRYATGTSVTTAGTSVAVSLEGFKGTSVRERYFLFGVITAPAAGNVTAGLTVVRGSGSGTITRDGAANNPSVILVLDIGPS